MPTTHPWYLRKHADGSVFGPLTFQELARWASTAQIAPHDSISGDQTTWMKAPMLPELAMDWIVEVTSERYYGPTTLGAIREFIRLEEIDDDTYVINACDGTRQQIREIADLLAAQQAYETQESAISAPAAAGISIKLEDRIRELEQALREERRALADAEERYAGLEAKFRELTAEAGPS